MFDILITGGTLVDGTGAPRRRADVAVKSGRIAAVGGDMSGAEAALRIDAAGKIVCPGFIDAHSHSDAYLLVEPSAQSKISQGVTTEIIGNCGASAAPIASPADLPSDWRDKPYPRPWRTFAEYLELLRDIRPAVNVLPLVGHGRIHCAVAGMNNTPAGADEIRGMRRLLEQCLDEGARGMSTGLIYAPGLFASAEELRALCETLAARGAIYSSHMRNEASRLLDSLDETLAMARLNGLIVQISHLKASGKKNSSLAAPALERIALARGSGLRAAADCYPYTASNTDLDILLPAWAREGGPADILKRLHDPETRARLHDEIRAGRSEEYWADVVIASTFHPDTRRLSGLTVSRAAELLGIPPAETVLRVIEADELRTTAFFFGMTEESMKLFLAAPFVMLGTDASLRALSGPLSLDYPHPRAFGAFPRFLRMALDGETVALEEAIRKMTSLPAEHFGLKQRGAISKGMWADITVFAPDAVRDTATYARPRSLAQGIAAVMVNGALAFASGTPVGRRAGMIL